MTLTAFAPARLLVVAMIAALVLVGCQSVSTPPVSDETVVPRSEKLSISANRPYTVMGMRYVPMTSLQPFSQRGTASWYGEPFHGRKTALGEVYDMYQMTAAHPTLPLPSYARVTRLINGQPSGSSVIVRVNDRGPFVNRRVIDLSYAAASRLGMVKEGTAAVQVELIIPGSSNAVVAPVVATADVPAPVVQPQADPLVADQPVQATGSGAYIVQLGVFANRDNAESFLLHMQNRLGSAYPAHLSQRSDNYFRVFVGVFASQNEARSVARALSERFGVQTFLTSP